MISPDTRKTTEQEILEALRACFVGLPGVEEKDLYTGIRRCFPNGMRCDFFFYKKSFGILRFNRGAYMVAQEPILWFAFDEVNKVIGKIKLREVGDIQQKAIPAIIARLPNYPKNVRYDAHLKKFF